MLQSLDESINKSLKENVDNIYAKKNLKNKLWEKPDSIDLINLSMYLAI